MVDTAQSENLFIDEIIDLEEFAKSGKVPPARCRGYRIRIDKQSYTVTRSKMTGKEILELAEKNPERHRLDQKFKGGKTQKIELNEVVNLATPGLERFHTLPLDQMDGYACRKQFQLPEVDTEWLDASGFTWETIVDVGCQWVILHDFPIPSGYTATAAKIGLRIQPGYPDTQIDMAYFFPFLERTDGLVISATSPLGVDGTIWQQWSRHRTAEYPWQPGLDYIGTHMGLVESWLERELSEA
jgi:hypothetical protein